MTFFGESPKPIETWRKFENFLGRLLSANLVLPEAMEDQSIRLLKSDWPLVIGSYFSTVIDFFFLMKTFFR